MKRLKKSAKRLFARFRGPDSSETTTKNIRAIMDNQVVANYHRKKGPCGFCRTSAESTGRSLPAFAMAVITLAVLAITHLPSVSHAYGEQITQAGIQLYTWIRGAGAVITCLGLAIGGIRFAMGDHEAAVKCGKVVLGGLIIMLAPAIIGLLQGVAGGAGAINTNG